MDGMMRQCSKCKQWKPLYCFYRDRSGYYRANCNARECHRGNPQPTAWTPDRLSRLLDLVARGRGPSAIAQELGVTKNTVSGKMHRMGLDGMRRPPDETTNDRLDALHAKMDELLRDKSWM